MDTLILKAMRFIGLMLEYSAMGIVCKNRKTVRYILCGTAYMQLAYASFGYQLEFKSGREDRWSQQHFWENDKN